MKPGSRSAQALLRANQQNAQSVVALVDAGNCAMDEGDANKASECFQAAIDLMVASQSRDDKRLAIARYNAARAHAALGRGDEAIREYEAALTLRPRFPEAQNNLGMILLDRERFEDAAKLFQKAVAAHPLLAAAHYGLGVALQNLGDNTNAAMCYQKALALNPDFYASWVNLGLICYAIGSADVAVHCYNEAIGLNAENAELHFQLGLAYMMLEQFADATRAFTKALELQPDFPLAKDGLEEAMYFKLASMGETQPA
jgi:superkiller protein 3